MTQIQALQMLQARIKNSRLFTGEKSKIARLYIPFGMQGRGIKTSAWFEVVNDRLTPRVVVENNRHPNYYDNELASRYLDDLQTQFHELIYDCEIKRQQIPLHERLSDDIYPIYENSLMHQAQALRFCCSMKVTALFADTGTGKSKIAIDLCISRYEAGQIKKVLIFCPVSTKKNFQAEIDKWAKKSSLQWKIIGLESMSSSNKAVFDALDFADHETQIIVDESHMTKNARAKRSKRIKKVCDQSSYKVVMTGTPVTENVHNLYMQYAMLSDDIISEASWLTFEKKYLIMGGRNGDEIIGYKNIDYLMGLVEPYTYQINKADCLDLPAMNFHEFTCDMTDIQNEFYYREKERLMEIIKEDWVTATQIFRVLTRMQQITTGYYIDRDGDIVPIDTNKPQLLASMDLTEQTIIFCKYLYEIDQIIDVLGANNCALFTGRNPKERDQELTNFVNGSKKYFVATMQSGGTGLNGLQIASRRIIFYSNSFSYFQRKQSVGRIDRQGQTREMNVCDLVVDSGIEWKILKTLQRKSSLAKEINYLLKDKTKLKQYAQEL